MLVSFEYLQLQNLCLDKPKGSGFRLKAEKRGILEKEGDPRKKGDPRTRGILASPDGRAKGDHRKQGNSRGITASPEGVLNFYSSLFLIRWGDFTLHFLFGDLRKKYGFSKIIFFLKSPNKKLQKLQFSPSPLQFFYFFILRFEKKI